MENKENKLLSQYAEEFRTYEKELKEREYLKDIKSTLSEGENFLRQTRRVEVKVFDDTFLDELEEGMDAITKIISNPRTFIREEEELVEAGLANKITTLSIQHFASHTQFIRNIDEDGNVIPEKILTIFTETDTAIYENRFVMTLIKKCLSFIETRYNFIKEHFETYNSDLLLVHNKTDINGVIYEVDTRVKVSAPTESEEESERNTMLLNRLTELKTKCSYFVRSPFMTQMKGAKDVANPIHMTNLLRKHPDYHRAYLLWGFLDKYEELGISFDVKEYNQEFSEEYLDELSDHVASSILLVHSNQTDPRVDNLAKDAHYNPEVIFTLEDETYSDGKFIYDAYPEALKKEDIPLPPLPEEVREANEKLLQKIEKEKKLKVKVEEAILDDKDKQVYQEVKRRKEREKALLALIEKLTKENEEFKTRLAKYEKMDKPHN